MALPGEQYWGTPEEDPNDWRKRLGQAYQVPPAPAPQPSAPASSPRTNLFGGFAAGGAPDPTAVAAPPAPPAPTPQFDIEADAKEQQAIDRRVEAQYSRPQQPPRVSTPSSSGALSALDKEGQRLRGEKADLDRRELESRANYARSSAEIDQQAADVEGRRLEAEGKEAERIRADDEKRRSAINAEYDQELKAFKELADNPPTGKLDPAGFWNNRDTSGKVGIVIAGIAQSLANAIDRRGPRVDIIQGIIDRDIEAQRFNIQNAQTEWQRKLAAKHTLVGMIDAKVGNLDKSTALARTWMYDQAARDASRMKAKAGSQEAKARLQQVEEGLALGKDQVANQYAQTELEIRQQRARAAAAASAKANERRQAAGLFEEGAKRGYKATYKEGPLTLEANSGTNKPSEGSMKLDETIGAVDTVLQDLGTLKDDVTVPGQGNVAERAWTGAKGYVQGPAASGRDMTDEERRLDLARNTGLGLLAQARNSGVINPSEAPALEKQLNGGPREMEQALQYLRRQTQARRSSRGD